MRITTRLFIFAIIVSWAGVVLAGYFNLLRYHPIFPLDLMAIWLTTPFWLAPIAIFLLFSVVLWLLPKKLAGGAVATTSVILTIMLLISAADTWLWLKAILFFGSVGLAGFGAKWLYNRLFSVDIPYWAGLTLALIVLHYGLFIAGFADLFRPVIVLPFVLILTGLGLSNLYSHRQSYTAKLEAWVKSLNRIEAMFVLALWLVLAAGFIGASTPEIYSDAMRMHIPFMSNVVRDGGLRPNYTTYAHVMLSPLQLLGAGGYLFLGEVGAKWLTFLVGGLGIAIIMVGIRRLTGYRILALITGFAIISTPFFWQWLTTAYQDLPLTTFAFAGLLTLGLSLWVDTKLIPLAGLFLGFTVATKLSALVFVAVALFVIFLTFFLTRNRPFTLWSTDLFHTWWPAAVAFLLAALPWYLLVAYWTGNPFFPALNNLFPSPYVTEALQQQFFRLEPAQKFPHGWPDAFIYPWVVTFQTGFFSETLDGAMGMWFLLFSPVIPIAFWLNYRRGYRQINGLMALLLVIAILDIGAISAAIVPQLRYQMPGLFLLFGLMFGLAWKNILPLWQSVLPSWLVNWGAILLITLSLVILFGWGVSVNHFARLPWQVYSGQQTVAEYLEPRTGGVDIYVNQHIADDETVLVTDFQQLNLFKAKAIYLSDLLPPQTLGLNTAEEFERFLIDNNVRYWVVNRNGDVTAFEEMGLPQLYWTEDKLVRRLGQIELYTLKPEAEPLPPTVIQGDTVSNQLQQILPVPAEANYIAGEVLVTAKQDASRLTIIQVWLNSNGAELAECEGHVIGYADIPVGLPIGCNIPGQAASLVITIHNQDGGVEIQGGELRWEQWHSEPPPPLAIVNLDPPRIAAGQDFNTQRDGVSRLRITTQNATEQVLLVAGTERLTTEYVSRGLIRVRVPKNYYAVPGVYPAFLFDPLTQRKSNMFNIVVTD